MPKNSLPEKQIQNNPLESHLRTFASWLLESGYRNNTVQGKLYLLADFGWWFGRSRRTASHIDELLVNAFVKHKRRVHGGALKTLQQFLDHLRKHAVVPDQKQVRDLRDQSPWADILSRYEKHLRSERGLVTTTISSYSSFIRKFLVEHFQQGDFLLTEAKASDISDFILRHAPGMSVAVARRTATAFRSFFRFLLQEGELRTDLAAAVPPVADWRGATLPKFLAPDKVKRVLEACDRRTAAGRRDYAILLLLARLGLRAGEVVGLRLEDINWRCGEILVRGKGLLHDRMPLPADVGEALAAYLHRSRPACQTRRVFVCMQAPRRALAQSSTLSAIVRRALARADLDPPSKGAHLLRHSLATSMLRSGATMGEIGEVLRHRDPNTTEIYAKVDFDSLRSLAQPWPMGGAQ